jgi:sulfatase maturation enzyme AslB (radical SAM superfamily)
MSASDFHVLARPIGPICNLDCKYCFYLEKESLYPQVEKWAMRDDVLDSYIRQYIEAHDTPVVNFACNGECPKHRFLTTPDGEQGLNYLCAGYKVFFHHVDPYMWFMASELAAQRAPANVMRWVAGEDARVRQGKTGRNDPCPCGSGRKFEQCCAA